MRNLHVIATTNPAGGGPIEGLKQIATVLVSKGHTVEVACMDDPDSDWLKEMPVPVHALGPGVTALGYTKRLVPWIKDNLHRFDAVVVNGLWMYNGPAVWKALKGSSIPYFVFTHGMLDPWFNEEYPLKKLKKNLFWRLGQYPVLRDAKAVLFTSEEEKILARRSFKPYQVTEIVVKYGSPGPQSDQKVLRERFFDAYPELKNRHILLYLSRIHVKKGCDLLIRSFAKVAAEDSDLRLMMAGPDKTNWAPTLQALAMELGISDKVLWPGMLKGDDKWAAYAGADAFVLPSHQENFGIVVAEALASGTPALISNKVNIWREIERAGGGLVEADTQEGTDALLMRWLKMSVEQRQTMAANARQCFLDNFEISAAAECLLEITRDGRDLP